MCNTYDVNRATEIRNTSGRREAKLDNKRKCEVLTTRYNLAVMAGSSAMMTGRMRAVATQYSEQKKKKVGKLHTLHTLLQETEDSTKRFSPIIEYSTRKGLS